MVSTTTFDAIVIGAGQAGPPLAERMSQAGWRVAVIERARVGGTCVNTGCIPTKAMVASAHAAWVAQHAQRWGVKLAGEVEVDLAAVLARKDRISGKSRQSVELWLQGMRQVELIKGHATFEDAHTVRVGDRLLRAEKIFINVGGRPAQPGVQGLQDVPWLTNASVMHLDRLPRHLVVVGGSYIGLEFAQMFRRFGSEVTVVQRGAQLVPREDADVAQALQRILEDEGIQIRTGAECVRLAPARDEIAVEVNCTEGEPHLHGSHVLIATGRQPNTQDLGLERAGVAVDERGYIRVNDQLQTYVPHIWALGDCNGRGAFTHTSWNDFEVVAANLFDGGQRSVKNRLVSYALYTDPPLARIGLSEQEVRKRGRPALIGTRPMSRVGRAVEKGEDAGFIKLLVDADTQAIVGATILGVDGDEAIHSLLDVMQAQRPYTDITTGGVRIHPTVSELLPTVLQSLKPLAGS
ncbi:Pyruvate/2-oxoglutarate dehydrogenase complex, dihydrolipoamide dehydrogenase (E3) component [Roseateles sp. YR242]|uniref:FAD-containing oxidoreductase n=1 Tax=Roseateles sp. YR242 TaxID=1855305 RepID=UPI0008BCC112|nr:FAD-containing oxidoreductase [Roseateles sp. YR242]SEL86258.1 Pyruvate/2-oxoglutarate dehydrogenase complex, dihydrolipoamide dehydrogenase (E3) component [Roseateles sp. YR242]